jgi:hypothetical protein
VRGSKLGASKGAAVLSTPPALAIPVVFSGEVSGLGTDSGASAVSRQPSSAIDTEPSPIPPASLSSLRRLERLRSQYSPSLNASQR